MGAAILFSFLILIWYCMKARRDNPERPNWNRAILATLFWPLSLLFKRYR